jgi:NADH-quinone oxidoreductase subunit L
MTCNEKLLYVALFAPLVGAIFAGIFGASPKRLFVGIVTSSLIGISFFASLALFMRLHNGITDVVHVEMMDWIMAGDFSVPFGFMVDQVTVAMMIVVTLVSTVVHIYSIGYMEKDIGFNRFFSYLSAFVFSMMFLVMSDNFMGLFIGWEGVGLCSWLLIGFWYKKHSAGWAANEAFIMNRIADLGMLLGIFLIYWTYGSVQYDTVFASVSSTDGEILTWIAIFLFIGAMGKSAQFPLHTWLADAMEGPTPVSALIHAATMVTAGVYLVIRANELFALTPEVGMFIASLGAFVALFAATMALVNRDIKRIIAYSTLSQLGYMFVAAGLGAYWIALFHLVAHAFFKALLFLGAGNVMHAMDDELDPMKMGGLNKVLKWTSILMLLASLALSGIYPFAGFFSKDKILEVAFDAHAYILWGTLWITAGLTAFYSFRTVMLVFFGKERYKDAEHKGRFHPHEAHNYMIYAMIPLAVLAVLAGFGEHFFMNFVSAVLPSYEFSEHTHHMITNLIIVTSGIAITGIAIAIIANKIKEGGISEAMKNCPSYKLLSNQYYIPKIYDEVFTKPYMELSRLFWEKDMKIVDATVDGIANCLYSTGENTRGMQSGNLSYMLRWMAGGVVLLIISAVIYSYSDVLLNILQGVSK